MKKILLTSLTFCFLTFNVSSQDRKGFYFSVGIAPGITAYKLDGTFSKPENATVIYGSQTLADFYSDDFGDPVDPFPFSQTKFGLKTNFNIGYGVSNQLVISYMNRVTFISDNVLNRANYVSHYSGIALSVVGITGLEVDYYLSESTKSAYLSLGGGLSVWNQPGVPDYLTKMGYGISLGGGYQLTSHLCADFNVLYASGNLKKSIKEEIEGSMDGVGIDNSFKATSLSIGIKYVLF